MHDPELPASIVETNKNVFTNVEEVEKQVIEDILEPNKNSYTTFRDYSTRQINEKIKISNIAHSTM